MRHLPNAEPKVAALVDHLVRREHNGPAMQWLGRIRAAYESRPQHPGGMSGWANDNDTHEVETMRADFDERDLLANIGFTGPRTMRWNPFGIQFDDPMHSTRKFSGVYTLAASDATYIGFVKDFGQIIVYHTV